MKKIQQKTETNPLSVLRQAIRGVTPDIAVKARRVSVAGRGLLLLPLLQTPIRIVHRKISDQR